MVAALAALVMASSLSAQRPARLEDIQATATRVETPVTVVPAAIVVISGEELRQRGIGFLLEALGESPALASSQTGSYGAVAGLFQRGGESDYTKLLIDGVPINQPGGALNLANIRLDNVDRIEIVSGPASVLHGADAMSGVIQVFTRSGESGDRLELGISGGSLGNREYSGRVGFAGAGWDFSASGSRFVSDGLYDFNSEYRNHGGAARLGWRGASSRVTLTARLRDSDAHFPTDGSGNVVDRNQHTMDRSTTFGLSAMTRLGSIDLVAESWYHRVGTKARDPQDAADDTTGFAYASTRDAVHDRRGGQVGVDFRPAASATLSVRAGIEHEAEDQESTTLSNFGFGEDRSFGDFKASRDNRQLHAQVLFEPTTDVLVQAGARHDDSDAFGGISTWRLGVSVEPVSRWRVWAAMGTAFKAPIFSELFANTPFEVGNPGLKPERSTAVEAGFDWTGDRVGVRVAGYHQRFRDLIQYVSAEPGQPTYLNLGGAEAEGIDAVVTIRPTAGVGIRGHLSFLGTTVTDSGAASSAVFSQGESLLRRPGNSGGVTLLLRPAGTSATVGYTWVGERVDADFRDFPASRITLPSYGVLTASWWVPIRRAAPGRPGLDLIFRGENLLDTQWLQAVGYPGRGRTLTAGGRVTY